MDNMITYAIESSMIWPNWILIQNSKNVKKIIDKNLSNNILIKNCFNYSLKSVAYNLYNLNLIETFWNEDISNGLDAMFVAWQEYNKNNKNNEVIQNIIKYNEVDCKVLYEILNLLKTYLKIK